MNETPKTDMMDILLYAVAPYACTQELDEYNNADPSLKLSDKAKKRIIKRLKNEQEYQEKHEKYSPAWEYTKRVAVIVLLTLSLSFVSAMSIEAVRTALWEVIMEWGEERIFYWYQSDEEEPAVLTQILEYKEPSAIGEEYTRYEGLKNEYTYTIEYEKDDVLISYSQGLLNNSEAYLSNENTVIDNIEVGKYSGKIVTSYVRESVFYTIIWNDNIYKYSICGAGAITKDELIVIAESVE